MQRMNILQAERLIGKTQFSLVSSVTIQISEDILHNIMPANPASTRPGFRCAPASVRVRRKILAGGVLGRYRRAGYANVVRLLFGAFAQR